jgi:hypothetical protein
MLKLRQQLRQPLDPRTPPAREAYRRGFLVMALDGARLPPRCVCCNEGVDGDLLERRLAWHDPAWYLLLCAAPLIYLIVRPFVVKRGMVQMAICRTHREQMAMHKMIRCALGLGSALLVMVSMLVLIVTGSGLAYMAVFTLAYGAFLAAVFYRVLTQQVRPYRIGEGVVELQGVSRAYLDMMPDMSPSREGEPGP